MIPDDISFPKPISITKVIDALLDESTPFQPRYLNRLSDLEPADTILFSDAWSKVSLRRREAILEDMEDVHSDDDLLCFEAVARLALTDPAPSLRSRALRILREYELVDLLPVFQEIAEHDPDAYVRAVATEGLATYIYMGEVEDISPLKLKKVEECLLKLIISQDTALVNRRALESLGFRRGGRSSG